MSINNKLVLGMTINIIFMLFEVVMGILSGSLSLMSDALCNVADVVSLSISYIARYISNKPSDEERTFGYGRVPILAALLNGMTLFCFGIYVLHRAYQQFGVAEPIEGLLVMIVGFLGLIVNGTAAYMFINNRKDINLRSAFLNTFFDAMASAGALITGVVVYFTGNIYIDAIVSGCIGCLMLVHAYSLLGDTISILLESKPKDYNVVEIKKAILAVQEIKDINNVHIWQINQDKVCMSCTVNIDCSSTDKAISIVKDIKAKLALDFNICISSIEIDRCISNIN